MEDKRTGAPAFTIAKTEPDKMLVFGWGSVAVDADGTQIEDLQGDMIDPEDLEKAAYDHVLNFRSTGERHDPRLRRKGRLVESCVFTKEKQAAIGIPPGTVPEGWWVGYKIDDPEAWEKIKSGEYQSFSVEGKGERTPIEKARRNFDEFPGFWEWLEENLDATREDEEAAKVYYGGKTHKRVAKSYNELRKFNPYHDRLGRFSTANGAVSFTYAPGKSRAHDLAIQRMKRKYQRENSALTKVDKPVHLEATLRLGHNTMSGTTYRTQSVIQAAEAAPFTGNLTLSYATPTKTTRRNNGNIDYEYELHHGLYQDSNRSGISSSIGIDWDKVQTVGGQTYESREFLRGKGFRWDPQKKIYTKNPAAGRQSSVSSGKLTIVGNDFPSDLSGVTRISGNTYPHRAQIKAAGFKWDPNSKEWVKPQVSKSAELWDDEPMRAIGYAEVRKFNPYHDARGRFTSRGAHTTFSPGSDQNQARRSIDAENARRQAEGMDQLVGGAYMTIGKVEYGSALKAYLEEQAKKKDPIQQTAAPAKAGKKVDWASMTDDEFAKNLETYMPGITDIATKGWAATHDRYQYADSGLNGDMVLTDIYKARGYNALPQMMDKSSVKAYIAQNKTPELYRGMGTSSHGQSGAEKMDRFQSDPLHFAGYGVLGNGTYAAQTLPNSARNFGLRVARSYSRRGGNGTQVRMTLQKGTKTASYSTVRGQQHAFLSKLWSARYSGSIDNGLANTIQNICSDVGRFGALRGYEAWYDRGAHSGANKNNPFWVITNRGALIIQNERYS